MKVEVVAGGRQVVIETRADENITYAEVADKALEVWHATAGAVHPSDGPAVGFQAERTGYRAGFAWELGAGEQLPVKAGG